jgi:hypothetical protein
MLRMTLIRRLTATVLVLGVIRLAPGAWAAGKAQPSTPPASVAGAHAGPVEVLSSWLHWLQAQLGKPAAASTRPHPGAGVTGAGGCIDPNGGPCNPNG